MVGTLFICQGTSTAITSFSSSFTEHTRPYITTRLTHTHDTTRCTSHFLYFVFQASFLFLFAVRSRNFVAGSLCYKPFYISSVLLQKVIVLFCIVL